MQSTMATMEVPKTRANVWLMLFLGIGIFLAGAGIATLVNVGVASLASRQQLGLARGAVASASILGFLSSADNNAHQSLENDPMKLETDGGAQRRNLLEEKLGELEGLVKEESQKQAEQLQAGVLSPIASQQSVDSLKQQDAAARHSSGQRRRVVLLHMHESSKFPEFEPIGGTALDNKRR